MRRMTLSRFGHQIKRGAHAIGFCPIFDWQETDVWKTIREHGWPYDTIYDAIYRHGVQPAEMGVKNPPSIRTEGPFASSAGVERLRGDASDR